MRCMDIDVAAEQEVNRVNDVMGAPATWARHRNYGYPDSLALCIIDSIQSLGVRYGSVERVVGRYIEDREAAEESQRADGVDELLATMSDERGGSTRWSQEIGNRHRTSTGKSGMLKAEAIRRAALALKGVGVSSTSDLRALDEAGLRVAKEAWLAVPGQRSGISWRYMLMLGGFQGVKPDRMILRSVAAATETPWKQITTAQAAEIVTAAALILNENPTDLDHAIWDWQRTHDLQSRRAKKR